MDPSSTPAIGAQILLAALPALFAALFATASAVLSSIPQARKVALRNALKGSNQAALDRYLDSPNTVESRWLVLRVLGLALCAILIDRAIPQGIGNGRHLLALLGVLIAYGTPSYVGMVLARRMGEFSLPYVLQLLRPFEIVIAPLAAPLIWLGQLVSRLAHRDRPRPPSASLAESSQFASGEFAPASSTAYAYSGLPPSVSSSRISAAPRGRIGSPSSSLAASEINCGRTLATSRRSSGTAELSTKPRSLARSAARMSDSAS